MTIIDLQGKIMIGEGDEALRDAVNKATKGLGDLLKKK